MQSHRGDWVRIHIVVLEPGRRAPGVPEETQAVPLEMYIKGWQCSPESAEAGDEVEITTVLGRRYRGALEAVNPPYGHDFGRAVPELLEAGRELRQMLNDISGEEA